MSKYNLFDILEGMSNDEWEAAKEADRLEAHPDRDKIKAIQALIAKEREKIIKKGGIKEISFEVSNRIDGLVNRVLLQQFLLKFSEIYEDMVEGGDPFDISDVIQYLTSQMQEFAQDTRMDQGGMNESTGPSDKSEPEDDVDNVDTLASPDAKAKDYSSAVSAGSNQNDIEAKEDAQVAPMFEKKDKYTDLADNDDDIPAEKKAAWAKVYRMLDKGATFDQVKKYLNEEDGPRNLKQTLANLGSEMEIQQYLDSVSRDMLRTPGKNDYKDFTEDDYIEDFKNYIADKSLQEHFGRFLKDYQ
jgi:hypothetical protein